jgi:hypothetical protein
MMLVGNSETAAHSAPGRVSRVFAVLALKPLPQDIQARLKDVIPESLWLG